MLNFDMKRKINTLRDILVGKIPDPKSQVEQITIAMIYKFMDDMDTQFVGEWGGERKFFSKTEKIDWEKYAWSNIMQPHVSGQQRSELYRQGIEKMPENPNVPQLFRDIFRNAFIPFRDSETINMFLKEINDFKYDNSEDLGNAFEMLLSIMGSQGDAGQFRTPRHIIDMIVEIIEPHKNDTVLDPACGTAGFLISAYKHIVKSNIDAEGKSTLTADDRNKLTKNIVGYDISQDMVRLSRVNMYLHNFADPKIYEYDTLSSQDRWDDTFDVILANPPFMTPKGGINPHNRFSIQAKRSEVLFVDYIAEHLNNNGRAGIIVPEGIVFQTANAYKELRKMIIENGFLYAVISLPAGVFNPYSGVKTSILLLDKVLAKQKGNIMFVKIDNDGFDLGAQRREKQEFNDIPRTIEVLKKYKRSLIDKKDFELYDNEEEFVVIAKKSVIAKQDYILIGERYREKELMQNHKYPIVELSEVCEVISGQSPEGKYYNDIGEGIPFYQGKSEFTEKYLSSPTKWTTSITKIAKPNDILMSVRAPVGPVNITTKEICIGRGLAAIRVKNKILNDYLFYILKENQEIIGGNYGTAFASINRSEIEKIKFPLPPLYIQEQIVNEIEIYQKIADGARQVVENYKPTINIDYKWSKCTLKELVHIKTGKIDVNKAVENGKYPFFTCAKAPYYIDEYAFDCEALLLAGNNATADYDVKYYNGKFNAYQRTYVITICDTDKVDYQYLKYILESKLGQLKQASVGSQTKYLTLKVIQDLNIPLPEIEIQKQIAYTLNHELSLVEHNNELINIFRKKIKDKINEVWGV